MKVSIDVAVTSAPTDARSNDPIDGTEFAALLAGFAALATMPPSSQPAPPPATGATVPQLDASAVAATAMAMVAASTNSTGVAAAGSQVTATTPSTSPETAAAATASAAALGGVTVSDVTITGGGDARDTAGARVPQLPNGSGGVPAPRINNPLDPPVVPGAPTAAATTTDATRPTEPGGGPGAPSAERGPGAPSAERGPGAPSAERDPNTPSAERGPGAPSAERGPGAPSAERGPGAPSLAARVPVVAPSTSTSPSGTATPSTGLIVDLNVAPASVAVTSPASAVDHKAPAEVATAESAGVAGAAIAANTVGVQAEVTGAKLVIPMNRVDTVAVAAARASADAARPIRLSVRLDPPNLGEVRVELTARGNQVTMRLEPTVELSGPALHQQRAAIAAALERSGFQLAGFDVANREQQKQGFVPKQARRSAADVDTEKPTEPSSAVDGLRI